MRIHKEGFVTIIIATIVVAAIVALYFYFFIAALIFIHLLVCLSLLGFLFMIIRFFRVPKRMVNRIDNGVISPADGKIVAIEETYEQEYFKDKRTKISIFMSSHNVHVNSYPIDGTIKYVAYHPGKYFIAKLPKSSFDNEHNSVVVTKNDHETILFRQIAGFVARRIVSYPSVGDTVKQGEEMGIIKFGSRVDVFLPVDAQVVVNLGDKVRSKKSVLAYF